MKMRDLFIMQKTKFQEFNYLATNAEIEGQV